MWKARTGSDSDYYTHPDSPPKGLKFTNVSVNLQLLYFYRVTNSTPQHPLLMTPYLLTRKGGGPEGS